MNETEVAPNEVLSDRPKSPSREQTRKRVHDKFPGHISWASDRANFSGCRMISFTPGDAHGLTAEDHEAFMRELSADGVGDHLSLADTVNLYFSKRANLLVLSQSAYTHTYWGDGERAEGVTMLITTQLDEEDLAEFEEFQNKVAEHMRDWREAREAAREADAQREQAAKELMVLGKKAKEHNLFEKLRTLEGEVKKLKDRIHELEGD